MVVITHVRMSQPGSRHDHIVEVKWRNPDDGKVGSNTVAQMVDFIENKKGKVKVTDGRNTVDVGVVKETPKYIRTYADGVWSDNLLSLPRF